MPTRHEKENRTAKARKRRAKERETQTPSREKGDDHHCAEPSGSFSWGTEQSPTTKTGRTDKAKKLGNNAHQLTSRRNKESDLVGRTERPDSDHPFRENRNHPERKRARRMDKRRTAEGLQRKSSPGTNGKPLRDSSLSTCQHP